MNDNTQAAQQVHATETNTPEHRQRWVAHDSLSGLLVWEVLTNPGIAQLLQPTKQSGTDRQRLVLAHLAVHADRQGVTTVSAYRLASDLGLDRRTVRNALEALEQVPDLLRRVTIPGKPTRTVRYQVLPKFVAAQQAKTDPELGVQIGVQLGVQVGGLARHKDKDKDKTPLDKTNKPKTQVPDLAGAGKETETSDLVTQAVTLDLQRKPAADKGGLRKTLTAHYQGALRQALDTYPEAPGVALVRYCVAKKHGDTISPALLAELAPNRCTECGDTQEVWGSEPDPRGGTRAVKVPCPECTQDPTAKRVSAGDTGTTYPPDPAAPADPRSQPRPRKRAQVIHLQEHRHAV